VELRYTDVLKVESVCLSSREGAREGVKCSLAVSAAITIQKTVFFVGIAPIGSITIAPIVALKI
jgi:hypothetical protein